MCVLEPDDVEGEFAGRARPEVTAALQDAFQAARAALLATDDERTAAAMAHVAHWDAAEVERLGALQRGRTDTESDTEISSRNQRWLADDAGLSLDEALVRLDAAFADRRHALSALSDDDWARFGRDAALGGIVHHRSHAAAPLDIPLP